MKFSGSQLRSARELLGLSFSEFAKRAQVNRVTVRLCEAAGDDVPNATMSVMRRLLRTLQESGIEFRSDNTVLLNRAMPRSREMVHPEATVAS